ncbi:MAG: hypothetical protein ACM3ZQ_02530 [Bacillota bacterium]
MIAQLVNASDLVRVAELMASTVPEWWTTEGAMAQLEGSLCWLQDDGTRLVGWVSCIDLPEYKTLEIDTCGFNDGVSARAAGPGLEPLFAEAEKWARQHGYANLRYIRTSGGLSCHQGPLKCVWQELRDLRALAPGSSYDWLIEQGFRACGILPDVYGEGIHGIVMIKRV